MNRRFPVKMMLYYIQTTPPSSRFTQGQASISQGAYFCCKRRERSIYILEKFLFNFFRWLSGRKKLFFFVFAHKCWHYFMNYWKSKLKGTTFLSSFFINHSSVILPKIKSILAKKFKNIPFINKLDINRYQNSLEQFLSLLSELKSF